MPISTEIRICWVSKVPVLTLVALGVQNPDPYGGRGGVVPAPSLTWKLWFFRGIPLVVEKKGCHCIDG